MESNFEQMVDELIDSGVECDALQLNTALPICGPPGAMYLWQAPTEQYVSSLS